MGNNLVIVESPAKAKTISGYLGRDYVVKSSMGHVRGLPSKAGSVDISNEYAPKYEIDPDKKKVIAELKKAAKAADSIWLASDEDREGEAIAWHLAEVLGLDTASTKRIVFHEITKTALNNAIKNPRYINLPLVESQQARQTLDYLVGFELSPVLWRKVRPGLSAGRVQSVAVRLIVEREREIANHKPTSSYKILAEFELDDGTFLNAEAKNIYEESVDVKKVLENWSKSKFFIDDVSNKPGLRNPSAPFTTSTLQQTASNQLGMSPRQTMRLAQQLYEAGLITYMRTDSVSLSSMAVDQMNKYIIQEFGSSYAKKRHFKTKSAGAQEAHEAIRPTDVKTTAAGGSDDRQKKLYNLIWRRTLASQMAPAKVEKTTINIAADTYNDKLVAKGEVVSFDGFIKVYGKSRDDRLLPDVAVGDKLKLLGAESLEALSRPSARFTEASLVRELEKLGIGRPSTYAPTIATIQNRGYVERGDTEGRPVKLTKITLSGDAVKENKEDGAYGKDVNKLFPTDTASVVTDFLVKNFTKVMDYDFTKQIEAELDDISEGDKHRLAVLNDFYTPFHKLVEASADISRAEAAQARLVGTDPTSGRPIYARFGRFGPMLQKGDKEETRDGKELKPVFAPLPAGAKLETVTLAEALKMFELPRAVGKTADGQEISASIGRFGPYIKVGSKFVSIKPLSPHEINENEARKLYEEKLKKDAEKNIADFGDGLQVLNGRFGPYVTDGSKNAKIPKDTDPKTINAKAARDLLAKAPAKKPYRRRSKR